uniref:Uncharacterized protein n=1 Tax=Schizaphis graminum TaxID=13262 RepID=A0A2S2P8N7_SCHGA
MWGIQRERAQRSFPIAHALIASAPDKGDTTYGLVDVHRSVVPARPWRSACGLDGLRDGRRQSPGGGSRTHAHGGASGPPVEFRGRRLRRQRWGRARRSEKTEKLCRKFRRETVGAVPGADAVFSGASRANNFDPATAVPLSSARRRRRRRL